MPIKPARPSFVALAFTKMQGTGNDFVVVSGDDPAAEALRREPSRAARALCDRRRGIGADQLLIVSSGLPASAGPGSGDRAEARMDVWNADGSPAEMCGNGVRCAAEFLDRRKGAREEWRIDTLAGIQRVRRIAASPGGAPRWSVEMGIPRLGEGFGSPARVDLGSDDAVSIHAVNVGNPHAVVFVDDVEAVPLEVLGPALERHERFAPERVNAEFVEVLGRGGPGGTRIKVRVWERGSGATQACGTGATAAAIAAIASGRADAGRVEVQVPGGELGVAWPGEGRAATLSGDAHLVFEGSVQLSILESGLT